MKLEERIKSTKPLSVTKKVNLNLLLAGNAVNDIMRHTLKPYGLSNPQFNVLRILRGQEGKPANLKTLQERMIHQSSNTTRIVDKLVEKELVERRTCPDNRRKIEMIITDEGLSLLKKLDKMVEDCEEELVDSLNEKEKITLNTLLEKFINS